MNVATKTLMVGAGLLALAACGETSKSWNQEAGAWLDEGGFGNPTMQNMMAQMCSGQAKGYIVPDPVVVASPSASGAPTYRRGYVMCSGHLNGKYAQVIFTQYRRSARPESVLQGGLAAIESAAGGE